MIHSILYNIPDCRVRPASGVHHEITRDFDGGKVRFLVPAFMADPRNLCTALRMFLVAHSHWNHSVPRDCSTNSKDADKSLCMVPRYGDSCVARGMLALKMW
jgi:hypothetical protein